MSTAADDRFDAVVIGSGYGGAVVAERLTSAGWNVCVLERGRAYPPGYFPRGRGGLPGFLWQRETDLDGLYEARELGGQLVVTAAGLGGGSLIDAGMLLRPEPDELSQLGWPLGAAALDPYYDQILLDLQPSSLPRDGAPYASVDKSRQLERADRPADRVPLAIAFDAGDGSPPAPGRLIRERVPNLHGRLRYTCRLVGECVLGCNYGAKSSLDLTLLSAARAGGAHVRPRCEVHAIEPIDGSYRVRYASSQPGRASGGSTVTAPRVVVSAGALGTTGLLLRNRASLSSLSPALGTGVTAPGLRLGAIKRAGVDAGHGPAVTSALRNGQATALDLGYPELLHWLLRAAVRVPGYQPDQFAQALGLPSGAAWLSGEPAAPQDLLPLAVTEPGRRDGRITLTRSGALVLRWPAARDAHDGDDAGQLLRELGADPNPALEAFSRGLSLQPLGGCPMGEDPSKAVVDQRGEVLGHPGLLVADGSLLPGPAGPAPALTIAAVADLVADGLIHAA